MSHFAVLVIGEDVEGQLAPFQENNMETVPSKYLEWNDVEDEYRKEYNEDSRDEFYSGNTTCLTKEQFEKIEGLEVGQVLVMDFEELGIGGYLRLHDTKKAEYRDSEGNYVGRDNDIWYKVIEVIETSHPDKDVCFTGKVRIQRIDPPKEIPLNEYYESFEDFMKNWAGYDEDNMVGGRYGYWENPNAKWDWFQIGGRYRDRLKLKEGSDGDKGNGQDQFVGSLYKKSKRGWCDSALKGDIDWEEMHQNPKDYEEALRFWEMKIEGAEPKTEEEREELKWDWYKPEFYTERYGDKETYAKCRSNFTMWAILQDGNWIEKGEMGWFGMSGESNDEALAWELYMYERFIQNLPDDTRLTVVDCHI